MLIRWGRNNGIAGNLVQWNSSVAGLDLSVPAFTAMFGAILWDGSYNATKPIINWCETGFLFVVEPERDYHPAQIRGSFSWDSFFGVSKKRPAWIKRNGAGVVER